METTAWPVERSNVPNYFQATALAHTDATFSQYLSADRINAARLLRVLFLSIEPAAFSLHPSNERLAERTIRFDAICQNLLGFGWFEKRSDCQRVYMQRSTSGLTEGTNGQTSLLVVTVASKIQRPPGPMVA